MARNKQKMHPFRTRGVMRDSDRILRVIVTVVLAMSCAALSFTQLGFAGITIQGQYSAYIVVLLLPVALSALLLGTLIGTCIGLFAGAMLLAHATIMPLDFYELTFVTPLTSVVMLSLSGLLLGIFFEIALHNNPSTLKRIIYIVIVCAIVSTLYSTGFVFNVAAEMMFNFVSSNLIDVYGNEAATYVQTNAIALALRYGDVDLQVLADAGLMAIFCIAGDAAARKARRSTGDMGLRGVFAAWLSVVVLIVFMVMTGVSFASITQREIAETEDIMQGEIMYLRTQIEHADNRVKAVLGFLNKAGIDIASLESEAIVDLGNLVTIEGLLDGYEKEEDGTILVLLDTLAGSESGEGGESGESAGDTAESGGSAAESSGDTVESGGESDADVESSAASDAGQNGLPRYVVTLSDDEEFEGGDSLDGGVYDGIVDAIDQSIATGGICRAVHDDTGGKSYKEVFDEEGSVRSEIVYVYAERADGWTIAIIKSANMVFAERSTVMQWTGLSAFLLLAAVFAMVFQLLNRVIVRRIDETNGVLGRITDGDLSARVEERDTREFSSLSDGINTTVDALKGWIVEAETRMDAELATAKAIQESALPRTFPPFPDIQRFDIHASMHAAKEVGGDFYDFFLIGDCDAQSGRLGFVIADVSGKGVPAALFMMKSMTQIRDYLLSGMEVWEAIENANRQLCDGNDAGMFVTAWVGVLDYGSGHVDFVNAGHNPPLLWQRDGGWRWLAEKSGLPLGLFDGFPYEAYSVECSIGDQFLLYTDGVTEAMSVDGELYGEKRLESLANEHFTMHPRMLVSAVRNDVADHARGAEQSDDITIMALEVGIPPEMTASIIVPADVAELPRVNEFIHTELDRRLCPKRTQNLLDVAVEELFVNVAHYAYPDAAPEEPGMVRVSYTYSADPPSVHVDIADKGIPYNPLAKPDAVTPDDIEDVPIGGLGILMAKRSVDDMTYERLGDSNIVTITKRW